MKIRYFLCLLLIIKISFISIAEDKRLFQFSNGNEDNNFISLELGTSSGVKIISKRMQLSFLYSLINHQGYYISTDFLLLNFDLPSNFSINAGFGGGLLFNPSNNSFESFALFRFPFIFEYKNFYLETIPTLGSSMFDYETSYILFVSAGIGYKFKFSNEVKKKATIEVAK